MAVSYSKHLFFKLLNKNGQRSSLSLLGTNFQFFHSVRNYSDSNEKSISRAMKAYLDNARKHDEFMEEQLKEYNLGKKHLANMMGKKEEEMTSADIDKAIKYLFPSGLFVPKSRPIMKPPEQVFEKQKAAQFDYSGRPFHFLFYTVKPNFSQILHDAAKHLEELNLHQQKMRKTGGVPEKKLSLITGEWISNEKLAQKLMEKIFKHEYEKFTEVLDRLANHPYSYMVENFLKNYWTNFGVEVEGVKIEPQVQEDGSLVVTIPRSKRKTSVASVKMTYPGEGHFRINDCGVDYFLDITGREQSPMETVFGDPPKGLSWKYAKQLSLGVHKNGNGMTSRLTVNELHDQVTDFDGI